MNTTAHIIKKITLVAVLVLVVSSVLHLEKASAQTTSNTTIFTNPSSIKPSEFFSVGLRSSDIDLDRATISWFINGKLGLEGVGEKGFSMNAGPVGSSFTVRAVIKPVSGRTIQKTTLVRPQEVDFLWHSYSHTPPFYNGRSLAPPGGIVKVTAMPNLARPDGQRIDPRNLIYQWSQAGVILGNASGLGKQSITLEGGLDSNSPLQVSLTVKSVDNTIFVSESITIPVLNPFILLYNQHPILGTSYENILREVQVSNSDSVIRAIPYYFSEDDVLKNKLDYKWRINNQEVETEALSREDEITLRKNDAGETGTADLEVKIQNMNLPFRIKQKAQRILEIELQ